METKWKWNAHHLISDSVMEPVLPFIYLDPFQVLIPILNCTCKRSFSSEVRGMCVEVPLAMRSMDIREFSEQEMGIEWELELSAVQSGTT